MKNLLSPFTIYAQDVVGSLTPPESVVKAPSDAGKFMSAIISFIVVIAGVYALWQLLTGGLGYVTSNGDKAKVQESTQKMFMAILGLTVIGASFIIAAVVSKLLFGNSSVIFSPTLKTVN
jgi:hypothetical protein